MKKLHVNICLILLVMLLSGCERTIIGPGADNTPRSNFEVLWRTMDEKLALFPLCRVNWDSLHDAYGSMITEGTTSNELWEICSGLLSHIPNGHITLFDKSYNKWYSPDNPPAALYNSFSIDVVKRNYLYDPKEDGEGSIIYGKIRDTNLGYIYIRNFLGVSSGRDWITDLDKVVESLYTCDAMIIDVRNNPGGFTRNDLYAASLFIDRDILYYYSYRKTGPGHDEFGDPIAKTIHQRTDSLKYIKPNAVLTNRFTASGGEAFTLICNNLPYSVQIGDTTIGALGEVIHVAQLPNGWTLNYPGTLTLLPDGTSPEFKGIIPDLEVNNTEADVQAGQDRVLDAAIKYLLED